MPEDALKKFDRLETLYERKRAVMCEKSRELLGEGYVDP